MATDSPASRTILDPFPEPLRAAARARLDACVDRSGGPDACWPWIGGTRIRSYGALYVGSGAKGRRLVYAHRLAFEVATGRAAPDTVDHTCHDPQTCPGGDLCPHRRCCNPAHMEPVSRAENASRARRGVYRETCKYGHPKTGDNLYVTPSGGRNCRTCMRERAQVARAQRPQAAQARDPQRLVVAALRDAPPEGCYYWPGREHVRAPTVKVDGMGRVPAHRFLYLITRGPLAEGHVLIHTCHDPLTCRSQRDCPHRACIQPAHLASVSATEAMARGVEKAEHLASVSATKALARGVKERQRMTECRRGHPYDEANTYTDKRGNRQCKACTRAAARRRWEAAKASRTAATLGVSGS